MYDQRNFADSIGKIAISEILFAIKTVYINSALFEEHTRFDNDGVSENSNPVPSVREIKKSNMTLIVAEISCSKRFINELFFSDKADGVCPI
jgi:hypothetical protein